MEGVAMFGIEFCEHGCAVCGDIWKHSGKCDKAGMNLDCPPHSYPKEPPRIPMAFIKWWKEVRGIKA